MFAQMRHMAIVSSNVEHEGDFFRDVFGMKRASRTYGGAVAVSDGYVGLNLNPRAPGRQAGFDHFGFEVEDVEVVFARLKDKYPKVQVLHRPSNRPFAGISMHDPNGNVFDLSQVNMANRTGLYTDKVEERKRRVGHIGLALRRPRSLRRVLSRCFRTDGTGKTQWRSQPLSFRRQSNISRDAVENFRFRRLRHRTPRSRSYRL